MDVFVFFLFACISRHDFAYLLRAVTSITPIEGFLFLASVEVGSGLARLNWMCS